MTFASFENVNVEISKFVYSSLLQVADIYSFSIFSFHKNEKKNRVWYFGSPFEVNTEITNLRKKVIQQALLELYNEL